MIDFPNTPSIGDLFYSPSNGITYRWDGTLWLAGPNVGSGYGPTGDFCAFQSGGLPAGVSNTWVILNPTGIISGNAGSWYVPGTGVYKPPPGRYFIQGHMSGSWTGGALGMYADLRKNAVEIAWHQGTTAAASYQTNIVVEATVDANGTDVFDFRGYCAGAAGTFSNVTFLAFPIAGAKGPPGDQGAPGLPGSINGWRQIQRIVPTLGQAAIDFTNIPADINDLELRYDVTPQTNGGFLYMQTYGAGSVLQTGANYIYWNDYTYHVAAQGSNVTAYNGTGATVIPLNLNTTGWGVSSTYFIAGTVKVNNIRDATRGHSFQCDAAMVEQTNTNWGFLKGGGVQGTASVITGLHFYWNTGGFLNRGAMTLWGSP